MEVYSFIHNCQNLQPTKVSLNKGMDKQTVVHPDNEETQKRNVLPSHEKSLNAYY